MPAENVPQKRFGEIALCLSGGGYRAATYALGTLDMLDELNLLTDVKLLSTVSGGTFTGLTYAVWQSEGKTFGAFYEDFGSFLKNTNAIDKALKDLYNTPSPSGSTDLSLIRSAAHFYSSKAFLSKRTFSQLTAIVGEDARFKELIFNATEFRVGNSFRFRASWDEDVFIGNGTFAVPKDVAAEIRLADIVASSSCFPGAFEPIRFPDDFNWVSPLADVRGRLIEDVNCPPFPPLAPYKNGFNVKGKCIALPLMDGGIYDNQGISNAVMADKNNIFKLFLITDTSPRENEILKDPDASPRRGWVTLDTLFWLAVGLFILCLVGVGILTYLFFSTEPRNFTPLQQWLFYGVSVVPAILLIGVLIWAYTLFNKFKSVTVSKARFRLWHYFKRLALPDAIEMVKVRVSSVLAMMSDVFMKRIRQLQFNNLMDPKSRAKSVSFNLIYSIAAAPENSIYWELDPELKPTEKMKDISEAAEAMPTTLWMTKTQFKTLIACGRCTTCYSLLKFLWKRWLEEEKEAQKQVPPLHIPKPNEPASPYYEIYTRLQAKWMELKQNPYDSQDRARV